jgi:integrase
VTVGSWLTTWLAEKEGEREYQTYRQYESVARLHLIPTLGDKPLSKLAVADVKRMLDQKVRDGLSPKRVLHIRAVLRNALNDAMRLEYVERNVAHLAKPPTVHAKSCREWNAEDIDAVLSKLEETDLLAPVGFALLTGVRVGELLVLRWTDMDHGREVHVQRSVYRRYDPATKRGEYVYKSTKTAMGDRRIPVNDDLAAIIDKHRQTEEAKRARLGIAALTDQDLVFTTQFAEQINSNAFTHWLRKATGLNSHDLRHGFGSLLLGQGADVVVISRLLGHSNIQVTANVYLRSPRDQMREAVSKLHR